MASSGPLEDLAVNFVQAAGSLSGAVPNGTKKGIVELLRMTNSYYSNLIEGHHTHPADIERAMHNDFDADPRKKDLQREARAHIEVQRNMERRLNADPEVNVCSPEFLKSLHREFYERVPKELRYVEDPVTKEWEEVIPGEFRSRGVRVGNHFPPSADSIEGLVRRFEDAYAPDRLHRVQRIIALATSHHRLMWIHPFLDGNGRVARLFSAAYARKALLEGEGLWSISRGLARKVTEYYSQLSNADAKRYNDFDGRGALSEKALVEFATFFLETALDQVTYMRTLLEPASLSARVRAYSKLRSAGALKGTTAHATWKGEAGQLLDALAVRGEVPRNEVPRVTGLPPRTARRITQSLLKEGLLESDSPKQPLRLGFPAHAAGVFFPNLYPQGISWR